MIHKTASNLFIFCLIISTNASAINYSYRSPSHIWISALKEAEAKSSPEELIYKFKEISNDEYSKISISDDDYLLATSGIEIYQRGHPYILYEFDIRYKGTITLMWEGYGVRPYWNITRYAHLYLWNYSKSGWDLMINSTFEATENYSSDYTADKTLLFNLSAISSCYVKNNYMYLLAIGPYGEGYSGGILATDYVAIKHEAIPEKFSLWLYLIIAVAILILLVVALYLSKIRRK